MTARPWPFNKLKEPTPADWGIGMTVCMSAICEPTLGERYIIGATDKMVSMSGYFSGDDTVRKADPIMYGWISMIAGNDVSPAVPIIERIRQNRAASSFPETQPNLVRAFKSAYKEQRLEFIEDEILSPVGFTWATFRSDAKAQLPEQTYERIIERIRAYELDVSFLVSGFDPEGEAHIFTVCNPGKCDYYDKLNFWAIGSGQNQALASLFASKYDPNNALEVNVAKVLAAKLSAESASGVGKKTWLMVETAVPPNKTMFFLASEIDTFREEWNALPKIPAKATEVLAKGIERERKRLADETPKP